MNKGLIFGGLALLFGGVADYLDGEQMKEEVKLAVSEELDRRMGVKKLTDPVVFKEHGKK